MEVINFKAYHLSLCDNEIGTIWPNINREYKEWNRKLTEEILENYRDSSKILMNRKTSLFVCSSLDNVNDWYIKKFKNQNPFIYTLELTGNLCWMNDRSYEDLFEFISNGMRNPQKEGQMALNYWKEVNKDATYPFVVEGLFSGKALIIDKIKYNRL